MKKFVFVLVSFATMYASAQVNCQSGVMGVSSPNVGIGTTSTVSNYGVHILGGLLDPIPSGLYIQRADLIPSNQDCALGINFSSNLFSGVGIAGGSCGFILTPSINTPMPDMAFSCNSVRPQLIIKYSGKVGIGTVTPNDKLEINSAVNGKSGLRFSKLTALTATTALPGDFACNKVLTVDNNGEVILIDLNTCGASSKENGSSTEEYLNMQDQIATLQQQIIELQVILSQSNNSSLKFNSAIQATTLQIAPNPFSKSATIHYTLPTGVQNAELIISDNTGSIVKRFSIAAGTSEQVINANELSAGNYQYSLFVNGNLTSSKQMVVTK